MAHSYNMTGSAGDAVQLAEEEDCLGCLTLVELATLKAVVTCPPRWACAGAQLLNPWLAHGIFIR